MGTNSGWIRKTYRIVITIGKHIVSNNSLSGGSKSIPIDKPSRLRVVVSTLEVIQVRLPIVDVAPISQRIIAAYGGREATGDMQVVTPGVVEVGGDYGAGLVYDGGDVALETGDVVVADTVEGQSHGGSVVTVVEVHVVTVYGEVGQLAAQVGVVVGGFPVGAADSDAVGIVGVGPEGGVAFEVYGSAA